MGRRVASVVFWVGAVLLGALFLLNFAQGVGSGRAFRLVIMAIFGIGCAGCVFAARALWREAARQDA
jgi:hypothetical protein